MSAGGRPKRKVIPGVVPRPIERLLKPVEAFAGHKLAGAGLLIAAAVAAMLWANSGAAESYFHFLHLPIGIEIGNFRLAKGLDHWINDGLMGLFFFLVGLEIKRELLIGDLSSRRKALLPAAAALGGMVFPAAVYLVLNPEAPTSRGWGIPMATDIAFALGILALLGDRVSTGLKVFLTALAIVDDIGAVLVIAIFYTEELQVLSLLVGLALYGVSILGNRLHVRAPWFYLLIGTLVWLAFLQSGVHATIAALLMAFTIPARTVLDGRVFAQVMRENLDDLERLGLPPDRRMNSSAQQNEIDEMGSLVERASAPLQQLERFLTGPVTFLILPVFALANAGVSLAGIPEGGMGSSVTMGVFLGLVLGKPIGIFLFSFLAVKLKLADMPSGGTWGRVLGIGLLGGVGFTMALFIDQLAFVDTTRTELGKLGILLASLVAGLAGLIVLFAATRGTTVEVAHDTAGSEHAPA